MGFEQIIFYLFAAVMVFGAVMVITARNPVHSALFLVLTFFASAGVWMLLEAEFLAIALVLVYVGAVMVLFLFVVMMVVLMGMIVGPEHFGLDKFAAPERHAASYNNTRELGLVLYTVYVYPFEIAAVILLVAIVAAIALTLRRRPQTKYQKPEQQVSVKRDDRLRIVKMDAEQNK